MNKEANHNQKNKATPKWHRVYYLLAVFDVVVVIFGLYLNHQIISIQNQSVAENQTWSKRLENYLQLTELAANVNAPGNDVFDSGDYQGEAKKLETSLAVFNKNLMTHYQTLDSEIPEEFRRKLQHNFDNINLAMEEMTLEARSIFTYFSQKRADTAGKRMAEMDRKYFRLNQAISELRQSVLEIQQTLLSRQSTQASFFRQFEIISGLFILIMVSAALFYGGKIKRKMEESTIEKEEFISELQTTYQLLKESQDELEKKVEDRTAQLSESKDLVENIISSMADMLVTFNDDGIIERVNQSTLILLGYSEDEIIGQPLRLLTQNDKFFTKEEFENFLSQREIIEIEKLFHRKSGETFSVLISSSILNGKKVAGVIVAKDITKLKNDEQLLRQYTEKLQQSNRELQDFAYVSSHDLQEPLRKVQAFGDRLKNRYGELLPDEGKDYIQRMQDAARRMHLLIEGLLAYSRVSTKVQPFAETNLGQICSEVVSDLEVRIEQKNAIIEIGDLPIIEADSLQMRQLFQNLISNALKFQKEGEQPIVRVNCQTDLTGDFYHISVKDNGIGFDEKYLDKIFAVFQRLHGRHDYEGSGIGLSVCKKIVERHGGKITANSEPGKGAEFIISLPVKVVQTGEISMSSIPMDDLTKNFIQSVMKH